VGPDLIIITSSGLSNSSFGSSSLLFLDLGFLDLSSSMLSPPPDFLTLISGTVLSSSLSLLPISSPDFDDFVLSTRVPLSLVFKLPATEETPARAINYSDVTRSSVPCGILFPST